MSIYDICTKRVSVRQYSTAAVEPDKIDEIRRYIKLLVPLYSDAKSRYEIVENGSLIHAIMSGFIGSYGKNNAPHFIAAVSMPGEGSLENVGFMLEQLVLKLTEMGIATCWIGGFFDRKKIRTVINMDDEEEVWILISFGYPSVSTGAALFNNGIRKVFGFTKRKPIDEIACYKKWGNDIKPYLKENEKLGRIMEAARIAPSAVNSQPWRFIIDDRRVVLFNKNAGSHIKSMNFIDAGIALCHIYLSALEEGLDIIIERENPDFHKYSIPDDFTYVATCKFK